jgi:hypothetical protein
MAGHPHRATISSQNDIGGGFANCKGTTANRGGDDTLTHVELLRAGAVGENKNPTGSIVAAQDTIPVWPGKFFVISREPIKTRTAGLACQGKTDRQN